MNHREAVGGHLNSAPLSCGSCRPPAAPARTAWRRAGSPLFNTGRGAAPAGQHPEPVTQYLNGDVYRVSAKAEGSGWSVSVPNALATAKFGGHVEVPVHAKRDGGALVSKVTLTATSESNPAKTATASSAVRGR